MEQRDDFGRAADRGEEARRELEMAKDDLGRAAGHTREALTDAGRAMQAGASGTLERAREAVPGGGWDTGQATGGTGTMDRPSGGAQGNKVAQAAARIADRAGSAAQHAVENVTDTVARTAANATDRVADQAAALRASAGEALESARSPLVASAMGALLGSLAGALGGWWAGRKLADTDIHLTPDDEAACQAHFIALTVRPVGMTFEEARDGYALGHAASRNPGYRGRGWDEVEPELRRGFTGDYATRYDSLRDFARYGYERSAGGT